jgi:5S rRNA maturation endonuclease (ribonuclease M5)
MDITQVGEKIKNILMQKAQRPQIKDRSVFICCPFHGEKTPSCAVTIHHQVYAPGSFYCFGCGKKGGWNTLAEKLGFKYRINSAEISASMKATVVDDSSNLLRIDSETVEDFIVAQKFDSYITWPPGVPWRNIDYSFMRDIEAYMIFEFDEQKLFLPVKVNGKLIGGIRASIDYKKYLTTHGNWVKSKGLFPFDITRKLMRKTKWKKKFVVLVEGPRDVARLILAGIPALAILGSKQWSQEKTELLMSVIDEDFEVVMIFDSDAAGKEATEMVRSNLKPFFKLKKVTLPEAVVDEDGKVSKCDVFNMSKKRFNKLLRTLERKYGN